MLRTNAFDKGEEFKLSDFSVNNTLRSTAGLPDIIFSNQKSPFG
jgi:hypothetical protein